MTSVMGRGAISEADPLWLGVLPNRRATKAALESADVILAVGLPLLPPLDEGASPESRAPPRPGADPDRSRPAHDRTHARAGARDRRGRAGRPRGDPRGPAGGRAVDRVGLGGAPAGRGTRGAPATRRWWTASSGRSARRCPADGIVVGRPDRPQLLDGVAPARSWAPRTFLYPIGSATLGYGVPAAIGAKVAYPDRAVVAVVGDGGLLFTAQELATAVKYRLPVVFVVMNDQDYGAIRYLQARLYGRTGEHALAGPDVLALGARVRGGGPSRGRPRGASGPPSTRRSRIRGPRSSRCRSASSRRGSSRPGISHRCDTARGAVG